MPKQNIIDCWRIQARAFKIAYIPFTHNFWVLVDPHEKIVDQLHGLAFDPKTGTTQAIGSALHVLLTIQDSSITWSLQPSQPAVTCITGDETAVRRRWQAALNALPAINALQLPYPSLWQHIYKKNSNTVFNTLGRIMGIAHPAALLPTLAPGIKLVISEEIISQYSYTAFNDCDQ